MAQVLLSGSFSGIGNSSEIPIKGHFNCQVTGFGSATVQLQRKLPGESSFVAVEEFTADTSKRGFEPEHNVIYRFACTGYSSGPISYRISR